MYLFQDVEGNDYYLHKFSDLKKIDMWWRKIENRFGPSEADEKKFNIARHVYGHISGCRGSFDPVLSMYGI